MAIFNVKVWAVEWCGYESYYTVEAKSEEEALEKAEQEFSDEYDLLPVGFGEYAESDAFHDADEDCDTTTIEAQIVSADDE